MHSRDLSWNVGLMSLAKLLYEYGGFEIEEPIGEVPQLVLKIKVTAKNIEGGHAVYIPQMKCNVELSSTESLTCFIK